MLKKPKHGMKNVVIVRTLLKTPKVDQSIAVSLDVSGMNAFSASISLTPTKMQDFKLQAIERTRNVTADNSIPNMLVFLLNMAWRPSTVGVSDCASKTNMS